MKYVVYCSELNITKLYDKKDDALKAKQQMTLFFGKEFKILFEDVWGLNHNK